MSGDNSSYEEVGYRDSGLPNITGGVLYRGIGAETDYIETEDKNEGAMFKDVSLITTLDYSQSVSRSSSVGGVGFDASLSNPIYGNSEIVQPPAYMGGYYVCYA